MKLSEDKKAALFKKLASSTLYDVGLEFGLDKHYSNPTAIKNKVYQIYREVANNPEKFAVQLETVNLVVDAVSNRSVSKKDEPTLAEKNDAIAKVDVKDMILTGRDKAGKLVHKKLDWLEKNPKELEKMSLKEIGWILGLLFDKSQIIQGQATEHIAVLSKIDADLSPEDALDAIMKGREATQAEKYT